MCKVSSSSSFLSHRKTNCSMRGMYLIPKNIFKYYSWEVLKGSRPKCAKKKKCSIVYLNSSTSFIELFPHRPPSPTSWWLHAWRCPSHFSSEFVTLIGDVGVYITVTFLYKSRVATCVVISELLPLVKLPLGVLQQYYTNNLLCQVTGNADIKQTVPN